MALATGFLAIAAVVQYFTLRGQLRTMQAQQVIMQDQASAAKRSADVAADQSHAVKDSAEAAKTSAKSTADLAEQNKELIKAAKTQANASMSQAKTSKVATEAAKESAVIARQAYEVGQRPKVFFKFTRWRERPTANKKFDAQFVVTNTGATAYRLNSDISFAVVPISFQGALPDGCSIETNESPLEQGADNTFTVDFDETLNENGAKLLEDEKVLLVFYGHVWWEDSLGRKDSFAFCRTYNKKTYPDFIFCPKKMKIPGGKTR